MSFLDDDKLNEIVKAAFDMTDIDKNGGIDFNELIIMFKGISKEMQIKEPTEEMVRETFKKLDKDNSELILIDEFKPFIVYLLDMLY